MYKLKVNNPWFACLNDGSKTVEGRRWDDKYDSWLPGDRITIKEPSTDEEFVVTFVRCTRYPTLEAYLKHEGWDKVLPHSSVKSYEEARLTYYRFYVDNDKDLIDNGEAAVAARGGMAAIEIERKNE